MNEIMLRGFIDKCAENRINPQVMLKYAGAASELLGRVEAPVVRAAERYAGPMVDAAARYAGSIAGAARRGFAKGLSKVWQGAENVPSTLMETAEGPIGSEAFRIPGRLTPLGKGLAGGIGAAGTGAGLAAIGGGEPQAPQANAEQVPQPAMLQQLVNALKAHKGTAAGIGAGTLGLGGLGAGYLKSKSKKSKAKKEDKSED